MVKHETLSALNIVKGFSQRFTFLLDRAAFPKQSRFTVGGKLFGVVPNAFRNWCVEDRIPGKQSLLLEVVEALLRDIAGHHDPRAVAAWLLYGDAVPNPFASEDQDAIILAELYLCVSDLAKREKIEFGRLPRTVRNSVLQRVRAKLPATALSSEGGIRLDSGTRAMVVRMLNAACDAE